MKNPVNYITVSSHAIQSAAWVLVSGLILISGGCWEEVHYVEVTHVEEPTPPAEEIATAVNKPTEVESSIADREIPSQELDSVSASPEIAELSLVPTTPKVGLKPSPRAQAAWRMSSRWSLAVAIYSKGMRKEAYQEPWKDAKDSAEFLNLELPPLPEPLGGENLQSTGIDYLLHSGRSGIAEQLTLEQLPEYSALAELAIKTHGLLLVYTPQSQNLETLEAEILAAAQDSSLPRNIWDKLVALLTARAPYKEVKQEVLKLHGVVSDYLAGAG